MTDVCIWIEAAQPGVPEGCANPHHVRDCEGEICDLYEPKQPHATSPPERQMGDSTGIQCHVGECQCGHLAIYGIVREYFGDAIPRELLENMDAALLCDDVVCRNEDPREDRRCNGMPPCTGWRANSQDKKDDE